MPRSDRRGALRRNEQGRNEIFKNLVTGNMQSVGEWEAQQEAYRLKRRREMEAFRAREGRPERKSAEQTSKRLAKRR